MKVEIWSDVVCPWCGIGQRRLDAALAAFEHGGDVEVVHRSFQLDPTAPAAPRAVREILAEKTRLPAPQLAAMFARIEGLAAAEGLSPYHVGDNLGGNTRRAHELLAMAAARGLEDAAWRRLYAAHFGERRSIFEVDSLVALGAEIGLDAAEVRAALEDGRYRARVEDDGRAARALGCTGVPFVVVDGRYGVAGAQAVETFVDVLRTAWDEGVGRASRGGGEGACGPSGCEV